jgi:ADP-heptose:LPS heptosyltransferase
MPKALRSILRLARLCTFLAVDSLSGFVPVRRREVALIVRLDAIGDLFVWLQSGAAEIAQYARGVNHEVVLLANRLWADYARALGFWDRVIPIEPARFVRDPLYRLRTLATVRRLGVDLLLQPRAARLFLLEDALARMSGARLRLGNRGVLFNTTPRLREHANRYYERLIDVPERLDVHETERNAAFVRALTGRLPVASVVADEDSSRVSDAVVVAVGAGWSGRVWPVERLAQLIEHVRRRDPTSRMVLVGSPDERELAERVVELCGGPVENLTGKTSVRDFVSTIGCARLVICNESAAYHIAVAYGRPVLCILGGGHYGWFAPYPAAHRAAASSKVLSTPMECFGCNWQCKYARASSGAVRCIDTIPLSAAIDAVDALLAAASPDGTLGR